MKGTRSDTRWKSSSDRSTPQELQEGGRARGRVGVSRGRGQREQGHHVALPYGTILPASIVVTMLATCHCTGRLPMHRIPLTGAQRPSPRPSSPLIPPLPLALASPSPPHPPPHRAMAMKCSTALVEPPVAMTVTMAFSKAL